MHGKGEPALARVEVAPKEGRYAGRASQALRVTAHYSDGSTRDVTAWALFDSLDPSVHSVSPTGVVTTILGVVFLVAAIPKIQRDFTPDLVGFIEEVALRRGHPFYQEFVRAVVLPNAEAFAVLISWGELLVGVTLILGLLTRFSAAFARRWREPMPRYTSGSATLSTAEANVSR